MRTAITCVLSGILGGAPCLSQSTVTLVKADAEFPEPFSVISGVRVLRDGRAIVSDSKDKAVLLVDFGGTSRRIGREGRGPGEFLLPNALAALPGDSTILWDGGQRHYLIIDPKGVPGAAVRPLRADGQPGGFGAFAAPLPRGVDARGAIYFQGSPIIQRGATPIAADSIPILRFDRARGRSDTVAFLRPAKGSASVVATGEGGVNVRNGTGNPLLPTDDWGVLHDGRVAVVRGSDYHIDFYVERAVRASTPAIPYARVPVDAQIKSAIIEKRRQLIAAATPRTGATGQVVDGPGDGRKDFLNLEPWPTHMPAFQPGAVVARSAGTKSQIWVMRARARDTDPTTYDVFDAIGKLAVRIQLPPRTRIVTFDSAMAYVVRTDDDDLQYLQRYLMPVIVR
jgi:hypothetical protein